MRRGAGLALVGVLATALIVSTIVWLNRGGSLLTWTKPESCTATVDGKSANLDLEQSGNAALMAAISVQRGMPARAASIAIATSIQESKLRNIEHGDRDSLGLFQQRPSQGWGSEEQILNPVFAINAFYDALEKVEGYADLPITEAAQAVQRSAYPSAYADHEPEARILASALTGQTRDGAFTCFVREDDRSMDPVLNERGLTPAADDVRRELAAVFDPPMGGFQPGGVSSGHMRGSAHYEGRAVDVFVRPINDANNRRGWAIAAYLVAQADRLGIRTIIFDDMIWRAYRSEDGWTDYTVPSSSRGDRQILEHRDHVHVDVSD